MKIGLAGYSGSGKSTLFHWLTGIAPDLALSHKEQSAMVPIPDERFAPLCELYKPKKVTHAYLELVDTPGLNRNHDGAPAILAHIREADCLVLVVGAFDKSDPVQDYISFTEDLLLADMEVVSNRLERLDAQLKRPIQKPEKEKLQFEQAVLQKVLAGLENEKAVTLDDMTEDEQKCTRAFRLFSEKPRMVVVNCADDESDLHRFDNCIEGVKVFAAPVSLQRELDEMSPEESQALVDELGIQTANKDELVRLMLDESGQMTFFTAGEPEVRTWILKKGGTALDAAASIHTDLARGFIRAEVMTVTDLLAAGSEREVKARNQLRQEPKGYVVKDGDILLIRFSV